MQVLLWIKNLYRIIFVLLGGGALIYCLNNKDNYTQGYRDNDMPVIFDEYALIDFVFDWPLIVIVALGMVWVIIDYFRFSSSEDRLKASGKVSLVILFGLIGWMVCFYIQGSYLSW